MIYYYHYIKIIIDTIILYHSTAYLATFFIPINNEIKKI